MEFVVISTTEQDRILTETLRARGQRVTSQRLVIHRLLRRRNEHVTAEQVLAAVGRTLPGTSLPTVYATLELFEELGIVRRVSTGGAVLFDPRTEHHHHTVCRVCGTVEDLDAPADLDLALERAERSGFAAEDAQLLVTGVCRHCR